MTPHRSYFRTSVADRRAIKSAFTAGLRKNVIYNIAALHTAKLLNDDAIPAEFAAEPKADRHPVVTYIARNSYYALRDAKRAARSRGRTPLEIFACQHAGFLHAVVAAKLAKNEANNG